MEIIIKPIGFIESEFTTIENTPRQSIYAPEKRARIKLLDKYVPGLQGLNIGDTILIVFYFHKSEKAPLIQHPRCSEKDTGVFSIRSPHRPNHIGISKVKITNIEDNNLEFENVDMLDGTPVIDIKPDVPDLSIL